MVSISSLSTFQTIFIAMNAFHSANCAPSVKSKCLITTQNGKMPQFSRKSTHYTLNIPVNSLFCNFTLKLMFRCGTSSTISIPFYSLGHCVEWKCLKNNIQHNLNVLIDWLHYEKLYVLIFTRATWMLVKIIRYG